ncbi:MAG: PilZ domain-containing protein [Proteobacteria bacterium]|nr:PilZ domain-containing protein [Pseudomonadota bacterium]MBU1640708.1 PilZ domain-containing protein [Pseudomonadota bacterium]
MKTGGVFVPLQDHFERFCLTDNFINCSHFIESAMACGVSPPSFFGSVKSDQPASERRICIRKKVEFPVTLSSFDRDRTIMVDFDSNVHAQTIDLALGGMRVRATKQVLSQGLVLFNFGEEFIAPLLHGFAEVCWHKTSSDNELWEAGLSFKDQFVKAVIAVQMST